MVYKIANLCQRKKSCPLKVYICPIFVCQNANCTRVTCKPSLHTPIFICKIWTFQSVVLKKIEVSKIKIIHAWGVDSIPSSLLKLFLTYFAWCPCRWRVETDFFVKFLSFFVKNWQKLRKKIYLHVWNFIERRIVAGLVSTKRLVYLLTFVPQSFMAARWIIFEIGENMSRGGG